MLSFGRLAHALFLFIFIKISAFAFTQPTITCVQVKSDGSFVINFKEPNDKTLGLLKYKLYASETGVIASPGSGNYVAFKLAFPSPANLSFSFNPTTPFSTNGNQNEFYFRIDAVNTDSSVVKVSECIASIKLGISTTPKVITTWNAPSLTIFNTTASGFKYNITRFVSGVPSDSFQTKPTRFEDFTPSCQIVVGYEVKLKTIYGCSFVSDRLQSTVTGILPDKVAVDSVSFNDDNDLIVTWPNIKTTDLILENLLYAFNGSSSTSIQTKVPSIPNQFIVPLSIFNGSMIEPEKNKVILALGNRNCSGISATTPDIRFSPIFLDTLKDPCTNSYNVTIFGGSEIDRGVAYYKVFLKTNNDPVKFLDSIPARGEKNNRYDYKLDSLIEGNAYKFYVRAYSEFGNASASSMRYKFSPTFSNTTEPNKFHLRSISANSSAVQNVAKFVYKGDRQFKRFELVRFDCNSSDVKGTEEVVGTTNFVNGLQEYTIKDFSAKIFTKSYCYFVRAINTCELVGGKSDIHKTMLLDIQQGKDAFHQNLTWNNYEGFDNGVLQYKLFRVIDFKTSAVPYRLLTPAGAGSMNFFEDDIRLYTRSDARVTYYLQAVERSGNIFGSDSAISNIDTANSNPDFFIPSAFSPNGSLENQVFRPSRFFIELSSYRFEIYDRFGQMIWSTTDPNKGWDGKESQSDVYVFKIFYLDAEGRNRTRYGDFILIK